MALRECVAQMKESGLVVGTSAVVGSAVQWWAPVQCVVGTSAVVGTWQ